MQIIQTIASGHNQYISLQYIDCPINLLCNTVSDYKIFQSVTNTVHIYRRSIGPIKPVYKLARDFRPSLIAKFLKLISSTGTTNIVAKSDWFDLYYKYKFVSKYQSNFISWPRPENNSVRSFYSESNSVALK